MLFSCSVSLLLYTRKSLLLTRTFSNRIMTTVDLRDMRVKYKECDEAFTEDQLVGNEPIAQFTAWFDEVKRCPDIIEPNAMCIATANKNGEPSARMVLLKSFGVEGFKFFTNFKSRKGCDLAENPQAALLFYWPPFNRQVRIEGKVMKLPAEEAKEYFDRRPLKSRISASISPQSKVVPSRDFLVNASKHLASSGEAVEKPSFWGGYVLLHEKMEFWQGQSDRLHDRLVYVRDGERWTIQRLAP